MSPSDGNSRRWPSEACEPYLRHPTLQLERSFFFLKNFPTKRWEFYFIANAGNVRTSGRLPVAGTCSRLQGKVDRSKGDKNRNAELRPERRDRQAIEG